MKKRTIEAMMVLLFVAGLTELAEPLPNVVPEPKMGGCQIIEIPTIEKKESSVVEITEEQFEDESFCDSLELIALCVEAEAGNQSLDGKRLVADVILNRVESERFPNTVEEVISQKYQFTTYWDGTMDRIVEPSEESLHAVQMELYGKRLDDQILFFTAGNYNRYCTPAYIVGDHYFGY